MLASLLRIILLTATLKILERGLDKGPIIDIVKMLEQYGLTIKVIDPYADKEALYREHGIELMNYEEAKTISDADCLIFSVNHDVFEAYSADTLAGFTADSYPQNKSVVIDIKTMYDRTALEERGMAYWGL